MPILTFALANGTENDADEVMDLLQQLEAVLDGGIRPANLHSSFSLDSQTQLTNNYQEVHISLRIPVTTALTAGFKDYHTLINGAYTITRAYQTVQLAGAGAPTGTVDLEVQTGSYVASSWVQTATIINSHTVYAANNTATSGALSISTASITGPQTLLLKVTAVPSVNPPTSGFIQLTLVAVRALQAAP
jgi:hypothetical protein